MRTHETAHADLRAQPAFTATPPQNCLNGCQAGAGDERGPVLCQPGHYLCSGGKHSCLGKLDRWLRDIPDLFGWLLWVKDRGTVPGNPENVHTKQPDAPAPMRLEVVDLLDVRPGFGALGIIHSWAELVRDERDQPRRCTCGHMALGHHAYGKIRCTATKCKCGGYLATQPSVTGECSLLLANLPWCAGQDFAADLYDELRRLNRTLTDTVGDYRPKPVGKCAALQDRPGAPLPVLCGGALVMDREGTGVHCLTCGTRHEANEGLRELGLIVGAMFGDTGGNHLGETA